MDNIQTGLHISQESKKKSFQISVQKIMKEASINFVLDINRCSAFLLVNNDNGLLYPDVRALVLV